MGDRTCGRHQACIFGSSNFLGGTSCMLTVTALRLVSLPCGCATNLVIYFAKTCAVQGFKREPPAICLGSGRILFERKIPGTTVCCYAREHARFLKNQGQENREKNSNIPRTTRATQPVCCSSVLNWPANKKIPSGRIVPPQKRINAPIAASIRPKCGQTIRADRVRDGTVNKNYRNTM